MPDNRNVGSLDHRITILRPDTGENNYGEQVSTFSEVATIWAGRRDAGSLERLRAREVSAEITAHYLVRYSPTTAAIDPTYRIRLEGGLEYNVTGTTEMQRNKWIEIHAVARSDK